MMGLVLWNKELFKAVVKNNIEGIRSSLTSGADVDAEFTFKDLIEDRILDNFAVSVMKKDYRFRITGYQMKPQETLSCAGSKLSALQLAVLYGWKESIIELINRGSNTNKILDIRNTSILNLMYSTAGAFRTHSSVKYDEEIIELLFNYGADPNIIDVHKKTALIYAVSTTNKHDVEPYITGIQRLLVNGSNPRIEDFLGTALRYKLEETGNDRERLRVIKLILDHDTNAAGKLLPELEKYVRDNKKLLSAVNKEKNIELERLLKQGVSPDVRDKDGLSTLHLAKNNQSIINILLDYDADPNIKCWENGSTPIFNAVKSNDILLTQLFLERGADPGILNTKRLSPLYYSIANKYNEITDLLLMYGANPDIGNQIVDSLDAINVEIKKKSGDRLIIDDFLEKIGNIVSFLNGRPISFKNIPFYKSAIIAEKNDQKDLGKRIVSVAINGYRSTAPI